MNDSIAIEARGLTKVYGTRLALDHIDVVVARGQCLALTGGNGAGKTTLLRCLASLIRPNAGEVRWFGKPAGKDLAAKRLIGMVAHESHVYPHLTGRDNLVFAARMCDVPRPHEEATRWLDRVGLDTHGHKFPSQMSKGMRQRLAVARAMIHRPEVLLLDEPSSGLDSAAVEWLVELIRDLGNQCRTICFATHDDQLVDRLADEVIELCRGRLRQASGRKTPLSTTASSSQAA